MDDAHGVDDALGFVPDLAPGNAQDLIARQGEALVPQTVGLEGRSRAVDLTAVGFDDEVSIAPEEVRLDRSAWERERAVDQGPRKLRALTVRKEVRLESIAGAGVEWLVVGEKRAEAGDPAAAPAAADHLLQGADVQQTLNLGLLQDIREAMGRQDASEIQERPGDGRARDPVA